MSGDDSGTSDPPLIQPSEPEIAPASPRPISPVGDDVPTAPVAPLFRQLGDESDSASSSDSDVNFDRLNEKWANLRLELETARNGGASGEKKAGKKHTAPKLVPESAATRALAEAIAAIEKEYLFDRKQAGTSAPSVLN